MSDCPIQQHIKKKERKCHLQIYLVINLPEEVDLICKALQLGFQLDLVHIGLVHILENTIILNLTLVLRAQSQLCHDCKNTVHLSVLI